MERFFKVLKSNSIYNEYFKWWDNRKKQKEQWGIFREKHGIETDYFSPCYDLYIIPTNNDLKKFENDFYKKEYPSGLKKFKKSSTIQKDWQKLCETNIKIIHKPSIIFDFCLVGKMTTRLFHYNDELYCSINYNSDLNINDTFVPSGYEEIKGSEFYKIIEQIEEEEKE